MSAKLLAYPFSTTEMIDFHTGEIMPNDKTQGFTILTKIEAFCLLSAKYEFGHNAFTMARDFNRVNHDHIDWHEFSSALDHLHTLGLLEVSGHTSDGMTVYRVSQ